MCVYATCVLGTRRGQKRPLDLELEMVMSHHVGSHCVAQADLKPLTFLPQPHKYFGAMCNTMPGLVKVSWKIDCLYKSALIPFIALILGGLLPVI